MKKENTYNPWLQWMARITAGATFLLIILGGIVTSTESGLAVPDWPNTFGYNMFLYPKCYAPSGSCMNIAIV